MSRKHDALVWPPPREMRLTGGNLSLTRSMRVEILGKAAWLADEAKSITDLLNAAAGKTVVSASRQASALQLCDMDSLPKSVGLKPVDKSEGYALKVTSKGALIAGKDAAGLYYGAQTLAQLIAEDGIPCVTIRDWPTYALRGAHCYMPPRAHLDFFLRFLDFMAGYKYNMLVLEVGGGMEYEKHPEINAAWRRFAKEALSYNFDTDRRRLDSKRSEKGAGRRAPKIGPIALQVSRYFAKDSAHPELAGGDFLTREEVRRIVAECRRRHIEIVPELQSLSHSYYLCCAHPEIAEREDDPWPDTYCPSNPKSYELLFDVMDEVIDVVRPRCIHIGHDEAFTFRVCARCRKRTGHDILAGDINKIHDFLARRGIRMMMWGDKLMHIKVYGGAARRRKDPVTGKKWVLPPTWKAASKVAKDTVIMDWYWSLDPKSERNFHKQGFEVIYGNFSPLEFKEWERRAGQPYVLGAEISSWCEVSAYAFGHNEVIYPFFPGAQMLWSGRQMKYEDVTPLIAEKMTPMVEWLTRQNRWLVSGGPGRAEPLDISDAAAPLPETLAGKMQTGRNLKTVLGTGRFEMIASPRGALEKAIVLDKSHPKTAAVPINAKVKRIVVLQGTTMDDVFRQPTYRSFHRGPAQLVRYAVKYADGKQERFAAVYGEDIGLMTGPWPTRRGGWCYRAVPAAVGKTHTLFAQEWANPRPNVAIESIAISLGPEVGTLCGECPQGEVIVAAVSVVT